MIFALSIAFADSAEALKKYEAGEPLTARRLAEEALVENYDDFYAHYVVAQVYYNEDGNLPRAHYHFKTADQLYLAQKDSLDKEAWRTHYDAMRGYIWVTQDLEQYDSYLDLVERHNGMYNPDITAATGWTLMKMERYDEARAVAETAIAGDDDWQATLGYNVLCAMSTKERDRTATAVACEMTLIHAKTAQQDITVDAYNAGLAYLSALDFDRAEELFQLSSKQSKGDSSNPHSHLAEIYLSQGRGAEAVAQVQAMQRWRFAQEPSQRSQSRSSADAIVALVLLAAGESERAETIMDRVLNQPDRRASISSSAETSKSRHLLIGLAIRRLARERAAEEASLKGFLPRTWAWAKSWTPDPRDWNATLELTGLHTDSDLLQRSVAAYDEDGGVWDTWLVGDLVGPLGAGVIQAAIDRGRTLEDHPGLEAYYDALETEVAWHRGRSDTLELAERALAGLPEEEVLLRARVTARAADHAYRWSDPRAMGWYERALQLDPSTFRRLGLTIPATVESGGGALDDAIAAILARSPRVSRDRSGFRVRAAGGEICLISPLGNRVGCYRGKGGDGIDAQAVAAVRAFHDGAFALPLGLSLVDLNSLDGTTHLNTAAKQQALQQILGGQ